PRRHEYDDHLFERYRPEPAGELSVACRERHHQVVEADARGRVEEERDDVRYRRREDDPGRPVVEGAHGAVRREEPEGLRPRGEPGEDGDAERDVRRETARARDLPEEEIHLHTPLA